MWGAVSGLWLCRLEAAEGRGSRDTGELPSRHLESCAGKVPAFLTCWGLPFQPPAPASVHSSAPFSVCIDEALIKQRAWCL